MRSLLVVAVALVTVTSSQYVIRPPTVSLLSPNGLRMAIPNENGITLLAVHYSINKPVAGVAPGDYNYDVNNPTGDEWVHENTQVTVQPGDTVYFWHLVIHQGRGYQLLDQSWTAQVATSPTTPTTPRATTTRATTPSTPEGSTAPATTDPCATVPPPKSDKRKVFNAFKNKQKIKQWKRAPPAASCTEYPCKIFEDNFDYLDFDTWQHEITAGGGGNWEFQYYDNTRNNSYTRDGILYLKPTLTEDLKGEGFISSGVLELWGASPSDQCTGNQYYGCMRNGNPSNYINPAQSARLRSVQSFNFRYGRMEIEAQMPKGDWIWPAIWLLPKHNYYGQWPASGEIDIIESRGNLDLRDESGRQMGNTHAGATLHWGPRWGYNAYESTSGSRDSDFADTFHKYVLDWDEDAIRVYFDDDLVLNVEPPAGGFWEKGNADWGLPEDQNLWKEGTKMAPFDQEFYLIMNMAVGGTNGFFPDRWTNYPYAKPWNNQSPTSFREFAQSKNSWLPTWNGEDAAMKINYVKVWKMRPDAETQEINTL